MPEKRMVCWNCPRYDRTALHCRDGKANPKKKVDSVLVAEFLGLRALCHYNPFRDALVQWTYFPNAQATIQAAARRPRRARPHTSTTDLPVREDAEEAMG